MIAKTIEIYEGLEAETGQHVGWHKCGQLRIANTRDRLDEYKSYMSVAAVQGIRAELVTPAGGARALAAARTTTSMLAALYHPDDGHIAPADVTQAMAKGARDRGAKIYLNTEVRGFERMPGGEWKILTNSGEIICEHIISATGNYARQTGRHARPGNPGNPHRPPVLDHRRGARRSWSASARAFRKCRSCATRAIEGYLREEGDGLMFGPYEKTEHLKLFAENGVPEWFGADLLEEDFDAVSWNWERAMELVPRARARRHQGECPRSVPDDGRRAAAGGSGLGAGECLARGGRSGRHPLGRCDRLLSLGAHRRGRRTASTRPNSIPAASATMPTRNGRGTRCSEAWGTHADLHYPGQDLPAARPQKTAPSYDILTKRGAVWGVLNGWEMPNWFAPEGVEAKRSA